MSFPTVKIKCSDFEPNCHDDHEMEVVCTKITHRVDGTEEPNHVYEFCAKIGNSIHFHRMTVGPVDGEFITPTAEQLQRDVDASRKQAAKHAHMRHVVSEIEDQIK